MKLANVRRLAETIQEVLRPFCERLEIAGSIRRQRPECGDIDLVLIPRPNALADLKARCLQHATLTTDGGQNFICQLRGIQLDLFIARPDDRDMFHPLPTNFGSLLLCRTGSKEHNIFLVEHAKARGLRWQPYQGVMDATGAVIASRTEEEIFTALGLDFVPPEKRERL